MDEKPITETDAQVEETPDKRIYVITDGNGLAIQIEVPYPVVLVPPFTVFEATPKTESGLILPPQ